MRKKTRNASGSARLEAALKEAALDPQKVDRLFKLLSHSTVTFGGYYKKIAEPSEEEQNGNETDFADGEDKDLKQTDRHQFFLMSFQDAPKDGSGEAIEYVPFYTSQAVAKRLLKKNNLPLSMVAFREDSVQKFFAMALERQSEVRLNPGSRYSWTFSTDDMVSILRLNRSESDKALDAFRILKDEHFKATAERITALRISEAYPSNLAEVLELAENAFDQQLVFQSTFKDTIQALPQSLVTQYLPLFWRMLLSLAQVFHFMHFIQKDYSSELFVRDTGLVLETPDGSNDFHAGMGSIYSVTDLLKKDWNLSFSILDTDEKLLIHDINWKPAAALVENEFGKTEDGIMLQ